MQLTETIVINGLKHSDAVVNVDSNSDQATFVAFPDMFYDHDDKKRPMFIATENEWIKLISKNVYNYPLYINNSKWLGIPVSWNTETPLQLDGIYTVYSRLHG